MRINNVILKIIRVIQTFISPMLNIPFQFCFLEYLVWQICLVCKNISSYFLPEVIFFPIFPQPKLKMVYSCCIRILAMLEVLVTSRISICLPIWSLYSFSLSVAATCGPLQDVGHGLRCHHIHFWLLNIYLL